MEPGGIRRNQVEPGGDQEETGGTSATRCPDGNAARSLPAGGETQGEPRCPGAAGSAASRQCSSCTREQVNLRNFHNDSTRGAESGRMGLPRHHCVRPPTTP